MPTIGSADIRVHYDGEGLPREARELGEETGREAGEGHAERFDEEARRGFDETGRRIEGEAGDHGERAGNRFGVRYADSVDKVTRDRFQRLSDEVAGIFDDDDSLRRYVSDLNDTGGSADELRDRLRNLHEENILNDHDFETLGNRLSDVDQSLRRTSGETDDFAEAQRRSRERLRDLINDMGDDSIRRIDELGDHFDDLHRPIVDTGGDLHDLGGHIRDSGENADEYGDRLRRFGDDLRDLTGDAERGENGLRRLGGALDGAGGSARRNNGSFGSLFRTFSSFDPGDNLGQLIALIVAFAPQIAVLASAAAGGLLILGGALFSAAVAAGGLVLAFKGMLGPVSALPAAVQPAAKALQTLVGSFEKVNGRMQFVPGLIKNIQVALQTTTFAGLANDIGRLGSTLIPTLTRSAAGLGRALNGVLKGFATDLASATTQTDLKNLFSAAFPVIQDLGRLARNTFGIIGQLLIDVLPSTHEFTAGIADATGKFLAFLRTPQGKRAVIDFLDQAKQVLGEVGGVIGQVSAAFGKLVSNPKNLSDTIKSLQQLGDAAPKLLQLGENLGTLAQGAVQAIDVLSGIFENASRIVDPLVTGLEIGFSLVITKAVTFVDSLKAILGGGGIQNLFAGIGLYITSFAQAASGDFLGAARSIETGKGLISKSMSGLGADIAAATGNGAAHFDQLDSSAKSHLSAIAAKLGYTGADAKTFGGNLAQLAATGGVKLSDLDAKGKVSLNSLASKLGLTKQAALTLLNQGISPTAAGVAAGLAKMASAATSHLNTITSKLGLTGRDATAFKGAIVSSTSGSATALSGLAHARSWGDIERVLSSAGSASRTQFANKIIASANASGSSISSLPPKIQALVAKYGTIPANKRTTVTLVDNASATARAINSAIQSIQNRNVSVAVHYSQTGTKPATGGATLGDRYGGIMAGGKQIAGGERIAFALGGVVDRATLFGNVLAGEAGPEAIVPLTGSLSRVDRSVRALSAYARGVRQDPRLGGGAGKYVTVHPGAIRVVTNTADPRLVGSSVLDRLSAAVGG